MCSHFSCVQRCSFSVAPVPASAIIQIQLRCSSSSPSSLRRRARRSCSSQDVCNEHWVFQCCCSDCCRRLSVTKSKRHTRKSWMKLHARASLQPRLRRAVVGLTTTASQSWSPLLIVRRRGSSHLYTIRFDLFLLTIITPLGPAGSSDSPAHVRWAGPRNWVAEVRTAVTHADCSVDQVNLAFEIQAVSLQPSTVPVFPQLLTVTLQ